jgi:hypothetical protein
MLMNKVFDNADLLCDWVNNNEKLITIMGICLNEFGDTVLFYTET